MIAFLAFSTTQILADNSLKTENQKKSYVLGYKVGENFKKQDEKIDLKSFQQGMSDGLNGKNSLILKDKSEEILSLFAKRSQEVQMSKLKEASNAFLKENAKKKNVKKRKSGLQYIIEKEGNGPTPKASDTVMVKYAGKLTNGMTFDQSSQPVELELSKVIKGWQEGIPLMKVGSKFKFFVPYSLGYGEFGVPRKIPPYSTLIFDVKLVGIKK